ncbi:MAG: hypothetical protein A3F74_23050 [Betaproteobacteria bacterium RIFCSPLOWO2_12_FULL_62_58]|nr:MAG: hypothetical protein A3F74_23050 [Betaproteobacteria bacterium RIFCSPLOWO2_12_FULL_62_58]
MTFLAAVEVGRLALTPKVSPRLAIHDITLREGEEAAEVNFAVEQKRRIYDRLVDAGVRYIQGGLPAKSQLDARFIREVTRENAAVEVEALVHVFTENWKEQIDAAAQSGAHRLSLLYPLSRVRLEQVQKASPEEALSRIEEGVAYAYRQGVKVRFSPPDGTRADVALLLQAFKVASKAGADVISITDTVGCMTAEGMNYLVTAAVRSTGLGVQVHCHNDFGLAMSNALAAVAAGATAVDTSVNGLGERAGNLVMAEFVTTLQYLYGVDLGIDLKKLTGLSRLVSDLSGVPLAATQALTGPNSFAHKLDTHIYGLDRTPSAYEFILPEAVGNERRIVLGKYSGPYVVRKKLAEMGQVVHEEDIPTIVQKLHEEAARLRRSIDDAELALIAKQIFETRASG